MIRLTGTDGREVFVAPHLIVAVQAQNGGPGWYGKSYVFVMGNGGPFLVEQTPSEILQLITGRGPEPLNQDWPKVPVEAGA